MGHRLPPCVISCLLFILVIPSALSLSFGNFGGSGVVLPNDPYIFIGKNLTLTCNLTKYNEVYNSHYLSFTRQDDEVIPSHFVSVVSTRSIVLRYPVTSPEDKGNYLCKLNRTTGRPEIIGTQFVVVEYEPRPVTEIKCRVYNWENMTCTWDLGVQFLHPNTIIIRLAWAIENSQHDCLRQTANSCSWWKIDGEDSFQSDQTYNMGVSIENTKTRTFYPRKTKVIKIYTSKIVEPAPVKDVTSERNSTCVSLTWRHEKTRRDKVYRVDFKQTSDRHWQSKHVGDSEMLTLCGLHPNTMYEFQVVCKPRVFGGQVEGFWSRPTSLPVKTDEDVPVKAPELLPGSYVEKQYHHYNRYNLKRVRIYWKHLRKEDANGNITYFLIDHRNYNTASQWETTQVKGETQDILTLIDTDSYIVRIRAATSKGLSKVFSEIYLPAKSEKPKIPDQIVEADNASKDTRVTISWNDVDTRSSRHWRNLTSYTVFWCRGSKLENCQDAIKSAEVAITETEYVLHLERFELYMYGVAVNAMSTSGKIISSGFKWNTCIYIKNTKPEVAPPKLQAAVYQPDSGLSIEWDRLSCEDTHAYIQNYIVHICPSVKGDNCSGETSTFQVDKEKDAFTIHELIEGSRYKVWVNAQSAAGLGPRSDVIYSIVIDRRLNAGEIGGIVVGALFVLIIFLFGIILCSRHVFRTVKQRYFVPVPIEIPHTSLPPLPPIPMPPRQPTPDSDSSDGIYEKIVEGPPSPGSSTESTTGVEAPLISNKWKLSSLKQHIYGHSKKERNRNSSDSGRGSLSQSADTLLMRLHPSHLRKLKKNKKSNKSESDSGVIVDGRGQVCTYTNTSQSEKSGGRDNCDLNIYNFSGDNGKLNCGEVNPYSCVDIVGKIDSKSEQLIRKLSSCDKGEISQCKGSTLSLPPGLCKMSTFMSQPLDYRAQSAGNDLDLEHRRLSSMKETKEFESSDMNSEAGTLDSLDDIEHETVDSFSSREPDSLTYRSDGSQVPGMNSYLKFVDSKKMESMEDMSLLQCNCDCHKRNGTQQIVGDGYVTEAVMVSHSEESCECLREKGPSFHRQTDELGQKSPGLLDLGKNGIRPCSQVYNLPPHFFGSLGTVVDPSRTTEL